MTALNTVEAADPLEALNPEDTSHERASSYRHPIRLDYPATVSRGHFIWPYVVGIIGIHLLSLLALVPWLFSWTGVVLCVGGFYVFGTLGINLCYHRVLTHRGLVLPQWLERFFALLGVCCLQDTPARWVAIHRLHHQHSDERPDPHSPWVTLFWGHMGWLLEENRFLSSIDTYERYARDVLRDPMYLKLERRVMWLWVYLAHAVLYGVAGFGAGYWLSGTLEGALQFAASVVVWGVFLRTVCVWHITWSVNSLSHMWGYQNYDTGENSRNNWFVALISNGEGWHNNHHADQLSAAHGHRWWEFDVTWLTIRAMEILGVAKSVVRPRISPAAKS